MDLHDFLRTLISNMANRGLLTRQQADILVTAANHPYDCTCPVCRQFWELVGPEPDTGNYGPFGPTLPTPDQPTDTRKEHTP